MGTPTQHWSKEKGPVGWLSSGLHQVVRPPGQSDWHPSTRPVPLLKPWPPLTQHTQRGPQGTQTDTHMVLSLVVCELCVFDSLAGPHMDQG